MESAKKRITLVSKRSVAFQYMHEQVASDMAVFYDMFREQPVLKRGSSVGKKSAARAVHARRAEKVA